MSDHPERCSCGAEMFVIRGGFLACMSHCDRPDGCDPKARCANCKAYHAARPTWAGQP